MELPCTFYSALSSRPFPFLLGQQPPNTDTSAADRDPTAAGLVDLDQATLVAVDLDWITLYAIDL